MIPLLLALLLAPGARAGAVSDGARAFEAGELDQAIEAWDRAVEGGNPSGTVLFDLGIAWYRKGDLPRAAAYFRSAQRRRPRDGNVLHNLALTRSGLPGVPEPVGPLPTWTAWLTPGELSILGLLATAAGSAGMVRWWLGRARALLFGALALVVVGLGLSAEAWQGAGLGAVAVVVDRELTVRDAPVVEAGARHSLPPGSEVWVLRSLGDFRLIEDGRGRRGWVPRNAILLPGS